MHVPTPLAPFSRAPLPVAPPPLAELAALLPAQVAVACPPRNPSDSQSLLTVEATMLGAMRPERLQEFAHGRACARAALAALGFADTPVPVGAAREPVWPDGIVGSITHCGPHAAAVAAHRRITAGLGIDLEASEPLETGQVALICRPAERDWLRQHADRPELAKLVFSAKESVYKCLWPTVRQFIDFAAVGIRIDAEAGAFAIDAWDPALPGALLRRVAGRYLLRDGWIVSAACIR